MPDKQLIDANALDKALVQEYIMYNDVNTVLTLNGVQVFNAAIDTARSKIRESKTIDAVEVVRCKDCKYRGYDDCPMCHDEYYYDEDDGGDWVTRDMTVDDGFCHKGAKMDGGEPHEENPNTL